MKCPNCFNAMTRCYRGTVPNFSSIWYCMACNFETDQKEPCGACDSVHIGFECPNAHGIGGAE